MARKVAISDHLLELAELLRKRRAEVPRNALMMTRAPPITDEVRSRRGFKCLQGDKNYCLARNLYRKSIEQNHREPGWELGGEADFMELIASFSGTHLSNLDWKPKIASAEQKKKAVETSSTLLELIEQGATLSSFTDTESLKRSLKTLIAELPKVPRPFSGKNVAQRTILRAFILSLLQRGLSKRQAVAVAKAIAPLFEFSPSDRDVQNFANYAEKKYATDSGSFRGLPR